MTNMGYIELIIVLVIGVVGVLLPAAAIVFMVLIYARLKSIEEKVNNLLAR
jgi:uncharacterized membrane protein YbaN (DUF454 family)